MLKTRMALVALFAGSFSLFMSSAAQAYPDPTIEATGGSAEDGVVAPGADFTLRGNFGGTVCDPWTATFLGQSQSGTGTEFSVSFTAPNRVGTYYLTITCNWDDDVDVSMSNGSSAAATPALYTAEPSSAALPMAPQVDEATFEIKVVEGADDGNGGGDDDGDNGDNDSDNDSDNDNSGSNNGDNDNANGILPDTGGSNVAWLAGGAGLLLVGGGITYAARRKGPKAA